MAKKKTFQLHNIFFFFSACCVKYTFFVFKMKDWISKFAYQKKKNTFSEAIRTLQKGTTGSLN